jgi:hypothetical protein
MTGEVINLRQRRRQAARAAVRRAGDEAAARHGRTKAEKARARAREEKAARDLEAHRREPEPPEEE